VISAFRHDGEFGTGEEWQLLLKTTAARYPELEAHILKHHPWPNPELAAVPIETGSKGCLEWIAASTSPAEQALRPARLSPKRRRRRTAGGAGAAAQGAG
jgi:periplasmic divalent cation tolerance protein